MDKLCIVAFIYQKGGKFEGLAHFLFIIKDNNIYSAWN